MSVPKNTEVLYYINQARTDPFDFSKYIKEEIDSFIDEKRMPLYKNCDYATNEGKSAWIEAYEFLRNQKCLPQYIMNEGLNLSAFDHVSDMKQNNFFNHYSSNGMTLSQRIERRCGKANGGTAECLANDFKIDGRNIALKSVIALIIDDGQLNRGHRKSLFSENYKYVGICSIELNNNKIGTCIDFHTENLSVINNSPVPIVEGKANTGTFGGSGGSGGLGGGFGSYESSGLGGGLGTYGGSGVSGGFGSGAGGYGGSGSGKVAKVGNTGQKTVVSQQSSSKTSTVNGKITKVVTTKIIYSDGSTEQNEEVTTTG